MNSEEATRNEILRDLHQQLHSANEPMGVLIASAGLCAWGEVEPYRSWPSRIGPDEASQLPTALRSSCHALIGRLRSTRGASLAEALLDCQGLLTVLQADRAHGSLLEEIHGDLEGVVHECRTLLLDDEAAVILLETVRGHRLDLLPPEWVLGIVRHPLGETQRLELARVASFVAEPVRTICPLPLFEGELVFDGGRPSPRMMDTFQRRQGQILCGDGSSAVVRAVLESDWRVTIEFDADRAWCSRIDGIRLGALPAESLDDHRDAWTASLAPYGLDTQTKMIGQPIVVSLSTGERFSM
ncbi:MAG: hypothetical protein VX641_02055 [Planctomycetota bacterium]|nr:hypothetical protein [Planctomycetota bacterium]